MWYCHEFNRIVAIKLAITAHITPAISDLCDKKRWNKSNLLVQIDGTLVASVIALESIRLLDVVKFLLLFQKSE